MRKQEKAIIWPAYFDSNKTRKMGRRVPKNLAVPSPKIEELFEVARRLGLKPELSDGASYPKMPWGKSGTISVEKQFSKEQVIEKLSRQLAKVRSEPPKEK